MKVSEVLPQAMIIALVAGAVGCRAACPVVLAKPVTVTAIGDDICAAHAYLDIRVTDPRGVPIERAEVWEITYDPGPPAPTRARLRWFTDASGRLESGPA